MKNLIKNLIKKEHVVHFIQNHERSFRTDIILLPTLVLMIKIFEPKIKSDNPFLDILTVLIMSTACYMIGLIFVTLIGDRIWKRAIISIHPINKYCGIFLQTRGDEKRPKGISRLYYDETKKQYVYRGAAYDSNGVLKAAWESFYSNYEIKNGRMTIYFTGKSKIFDDNFHNSPKNISIDPNIFNYDVFTIVSFHDINIFDGAGFDYRDNPNENLTFPIKVHRVDDYCRGKQIKSSFLKSKFIEIHSGERDIIFKYENSLYDS